MKRPAVAIITVTVLSTLAVTTPAGVTQQPAAAAPANAGGAVPKAEDLDRLLAPIALYPDALLGQILICAGDPGKLGALHEWLASQQALKGTALQDAATRSGFEPSFVAIAIFPDVVARLASEIDWTTRVGRAFAADRSAVFASIQRLRSRAQSAGKLKDTPQQDVETRTSSNGQQVIVIEPANPQVVYVPQYNPQTVYTTSTVVVQQEDNTAEAVAAGLIGFTAGIALGAAIDNDYYYGPYGWRGGVYMYDDAWDDWADHREDAREDWMDHREDIVEERGDRARSTQEERTERRTETQGQRTDRQQTRQETRPETQAQRDQRRTDAAASGATASSAATTARTNAEARGYSRDSTKTAGERSGTKSDAFSGYSSGKSERAASARGKSSRGSSRSGGGRRR